MNNVVKSISITMFLLMLVVGKVIANGNPTILISAPEVEVAMEGKLDFFDSATFDIETEDLIFITKTEVSTIQIFNAEGEMEFQLPVGAKMVKINKNIFGTGRFRLGFLLAGEEQQHFTTVVVR